MGYVYHTVFKTMICTQCKYAVRSYAVSSHFKNHTKIPDEKNAKLHLQTYILNDPPLVNSFLPESNGPPIEFLQIKDGFQCVQCSYAAQSHFTVERHYKDNHPETPLPTNQRYRPAHVQSFYSNNYNIYISVNPNLHNVQPNSAYSLFLHNLPPTPPLDIRFPIKKNADLHPMIIKTGWHDHLGGYMNNKGTINKLVELCALPSNSKEPSFQYLRTHVERYLDTCAQIANQADIQIRKMLYQYPM